MVGFIGRHFVVTLFFSVTVLMSASGQAQQSAEKTKLINEILERTDALSFADQFGKMMTDQLIPILKAQNPSIDTRAAGIVMDVVQDEISSNLHEMVPVVIKSYSTHFTEQELKDIVEFYRTPTGAKLASKTPVISSELAAAGQQWGASLGATIGPKVIKALQDAGYN